MSLFQYVVSYLLEVVAYTLYALALLFYLFKVKKDFKFKVLGTHFLIGFLVLFRILTVKGGNNFYYSILYVVNSIGWGTYFFLVLKGKVRKGIALFTILFTFFYFIYKNLLLSPDRIFDSSGYVISSSGIILLIFIYYHQLLVHIKAESLSLNFDFWIVSSQLIYHLGAFGIFLTYNHFTTRYISGPYNSENQELLTYLWGVHNVLLFLASLLTWVGALWIVYRRKSISS